MERTASILTSALVVFLLFLSGDSRTFTPCELAVELTKSKYNVSFWQIPTWVCLAHHASNLNTSYQSLNYYGLFRLSGEHWCEACGVTCDKLLDDDIEDDIHCAVNVVYKRHHGSLDGFSAWGSYYQTYCREPWTDLQLHDCHKKWNLYLLKLAKPNYFIDSTITETSSESTTEWDQTSANYSTTESPGAVYYSSWSADHVIFSDVGLMSMALLLVLMVAGIIEIWRRRELPFAHVCMNA